MWAEDDVVVLHGVKDLIVVQANGRVLVMPRERAPDLKRLLDTTDGNLSVHARRLEEAGYVRCTKSFDGRVPRTDFDLTERGRLALEGYLAAMEGLIARTRRPE